MKIERKEPGNRIRRIFKSGRHDGFTLVELIVVLVVLAVLAAVAIPAFLGYIDSSKKKEISTKAQEALTASQSALTELYNEGGNKLTPERRAKAKELAKADGTTFDICTAKTLVDSDYPNAERDDSVLKKTEATSGNIPAYTITYACYRDGVEGSGKDYMCAVYDGSEWVVFDSEEEMTDSEEYAAYLAAKSVSGLHMWDFTEADSDTAYQASRTKQDDYEWTENASTTQKKVVLHGFGDTDSQGVYHPGIYFDAGDGSDPLTELEVTFTFTLEEGNIVNVSSEWTDYNQIAKKVGGVEKVYSLNLATEGFVLKGVEEESLKKKLNNLVWDDGHGTRYSFGSIIDGTVDNKAIKNILNDTVRDLYPQVEKEVQERQVTFAVKNRDTLYFGSEDAKEYERVVTFRKYLNSWDMTYADNADMDQTDLHRSDWASLLTKYTVHPAEGCEQSGWGRVMAEGYEYTDEGKLKIYSTPEEVWELVFTSGLSDDVAENLLFHGNVTTKKDIILDAGPLADFVGYNSKTFRLYIKVSELETDPAKAIVSDDFSRLDAFPLVPGTGQRYVGWQERVTEQRFPKNVDETELEDVKAYVAAGNLREYTFDAMIENASRAKFIGRTDGDANTQWNDTTKFIGQMRALSNASRRKADFKAFIRLDYKDGMEILSQYGMLDYVIQSPRPESIYDYKAKSSSSHTLETSPNKSGVKVGEVTGKVEKLYVIWDGNDEVYDLPIYAFNIRKSANEYYAYWFSQEPHPELEGNQKELFGNFNGLNLEDSGIEDWNTSTCTNMYQMFINDYALTADQVDFRKWNFSSVKTMREMFSNCTGLTTMNLSGIGPRNCTTCYRLFYGCTNLTSIHLEDGRFDSCTTFAEMFNSCSILESINMDRLYTPALTTNMSLSLGKLETFSARGWNASSLKSLASFFTGAGNLKYVYIQSYDEEHPTDFSSCTSVQGMFDGRVYLEEVSLKGVLLPKCTNINNLFRGCTSLKKVILDQCDMSGFKGTIPANMLPTNIQEVYAREWDIRGATSLQSMFGSTGKPGTNSINVGNEDLQVDLFRQVKKVDFEGANMSSVKNMSYMFANCYNVVDISFRNAKLGSEADDYMNMEFAFYHCLNLWKVDLRVDGKLEPKNMQYLFDFCYTLGKEIEGVKGGLYFSDDFNTEHVTTMRNTFYNCQSLINEADHSLDQKPFEAWDYSSVTTTYRMLYGTKYAEINFINKDMPELTTMEEMFKATETPKVTFRNCHMDKLTTVKNMFYLSVVQEVSFDGTTMNNPAGVGGFSSMFSNSEILETFSGRGWSIHVEEGVTPATSLENMFLKRPILWKVDLTGASLNGVKSLKAMFSTCPGLQEVYFDNADMSGVADLANLFQGCESIARFSANGWNISRMTSLKTLFYGRSSLEYVSMRNVVLNPTSTVSFEQSFYNCTSLVSFDMGGEMETKVKVNLIQTFEGATSLTGDGIVMGSWVQPVLMRRTFCGMTATGFDLSGWDLTQVTSFESTFRSCKSMTSVTFPSYNHFNKVTTFKEMFYECQSFTPDAFAAMLATWDLSGSNLNFSASGGDEVRIIFWNTSLFTTERVYQTIDGSYKLGGNIAKEVPAQKLKKVN